jgi:aryl-phospho-beta-D-glucosidase BglC (GH1 family)
MACTVVAVRASVRYVLFAAAILWLAAVAASTGFAASDGHRTYTTGSTHPLRTALFDPSEFNGPNPQAFALTRSAGAQYVRLVAPWSSLAPANPGADFAAADPSSPGYYWHALDATVKTAVSAGLTPILDITLTPGWAYAVRPDGVNQGTPQTAALGQFALALATHYDGESGVPEVNDFEVWNEPNLSLNLGPAKASTYRAMVNAVASSVHAVDPSNLVVAGGLDPFRHKRNKHHAWNSVAPLAFMRSLLCLSKGSHPHATCKDKIDFDVWSHHPYTFGGPFGTSKTPGDVELGNLSQMRTLLRAAVKAHHVVSTHPVQFWVTEFGWDSNPPRKGAASMALASRWTAESLWQAWRSGVSLLTWLALVDEPGSSIFQSGLYFYTTSLQNARSKPLLTAFRFPFVAYLHGKNLSVWGRDATSTKARVTIQLRHGSRGSWRTVAYIVTNSNGIFQATPKLKASKKDWLRAVAPGSGRSLAFSLTVPRAPHIGPFT